MTQKLNPSKVVYIVTTPKCSACKCMEYIFKNIQDENNKFTLTVTDFHDVPKWLKANISFTDFPTVIFIDNDVIKYHFSGTHNRKKILGIMNDINF